jgi:hypothetical protein
LYNLSEYSHGRVPTLEEATVIYKRMSKIKQVLRNLNFEEEIEEFIHKAFWVIDYSSYHWIMHNGVFQKFNLMDGCFSVWEQENNEWANLWAWEILVKGSL